MSVQEKAVSTGAAQEIPSDTGVLDITEDKVLELMRSRAFAGELYTGPHAYTADELAEKWGYKARSSIDSRMARAVKRGEFVKVKIDDPDGGRPLNAWVLTEIYEAWRVENGYTD